MRSTTRNKNSQPPTGCLNMGIIQDAYIAGGTYGRKPTSTHVATAWHIPGSWDYHNATCVQFFFDDEPSAKRFVSRWDRLPEMTEYHTIEQHDSMTKQLRKADHADESKHAERPGRS